MKTIILVEDYKVATIVDGGQVIVERAGIGGSTHLITLTKEELTRILAEI